MDLKTMITEVVTKFKKMIIRRQQKPTMTQANFCNSEPSDHLPVLQIVPTNKTFQYQGSNWLIDFMGNDFSEHGEDGIIAKIFEILTPENKWVCEFGAHDPELISNTHKLINQNGWNAFLIEAADDYFEKLQSYYAGSSTVHCRQTKVSFEGEERLDEILKSSSVPIDLDFMVIDIDGNDYHVWEAIETYKAKVVMIEFNASIPVDVSFIQPRDMSINQGSSLRAMTELAELKGYKLIAVTSWNAFFVKKRYYNLFFSNEPALENMYVYPVKQPIMMSPFLCYDGKLIISAWNKMLWHKIELNPNDYQIIPGSYRNFSRELAAQDYVLEKNGEKTPLADVITPHLTILAEMPQNIISRFAKNYFSRYGEDGIIEKLIELVCADKMYFVEVGGWDGITYSRTRNLFLNHRWNGLVVESDPSIFLTLSKNIPLGSGIDIHRGAYTYSGQNTLDSIFEGYGVPKDLDFLMLNTFGDEYHIWDSIKEISPKLVGVQFNPTIPNDVKFIQVKNSAVHQGCSLRALWELAHYKDYELVGVTLETAFFVKRQYSYRLFELMGICCLDLDKVFIPLQMHLFQLYDGTIALSGLDRLPWHAIRIDHEKLQVVPKSLRKFHQFAGSHKKFFYAV